MRQTFQLNDAVKKGARGDVGRHAHVIGAGVMGGDIAAVAAMSGFTVTLQDLSAEAIEGASTVPVACMSTPKSPKRRRYCHD